MVACPLETTSMSLKMNPIDEDCIWFVTQTPKTIMLCSLCVIVLRRGVGISVGVIIFAQCSKPQGQT